jgi:hypothetical protein
VTVIFLLLSNGELARSFQLCSLLEALSGVPLANHLLHLQLVASF